MLRAPARMRGGGREDTREIVYEAFFAALAVGLSGGKAQGWSKIPHDAQTTWLSKAVRALERLAGDIADRWTISRLWPTLRDIYGVFELEWPTWRPYDTHRPFISVRLALRDVAVDLCTIAKGLDPNALIDLNDIESASMSPFWLDELWLWDFSERRLPLHTSEAAQAFVERVGRHLDTTITEFNERATDAAKLGLFASDHGLDRLAQKELRRAVGCLLGYGWRKDPFAYEVLESLDLLAKNGDTEARKAILDLAGEFAAITDYTDGAETYEIAEKYYKAIARHFPERTAACYAHLIRDEQWQYAEALAITIANTSQVASRTGRALLETYIAPSEVYVLERNRSADCPHIKAALTAVRRKIGRTSEAPPERRGMQPSADPKPISSDSERAETEVSVPDPSDFPPGRLQGYLNATRKLRSSDDRSKVLIEWLRYWEAVGRVDEALTDLEAGTSEMRRGLGLHKALDVAFEIALKTQGRSKALPWLIRAHVTGSGWQRWFNTDGEAHARMRKVAEHYRGHWQEFVRKTAKPIFETRTTSDWIVIGLYSFVHFLVEVDELDIARTYALEMARVFKEELTEQPIEAPEWSR